jgi:hypothetical protein
VREAGGGAVILLILLVAAYLMPTIIASVRGVPNLGSVIVVNLFLGWTLVGWVVALAMAARSAPPTQSTQVYVQPEGSPTQQPPKQPDNVVWLFAGESYGLGRMFDPPMYGIWLRSDLAAPLYRFPYTPHGKDEALEQLRQLEPNATPIP